MRTIGTDYVAYMEKKLVYFEDQSQKLFGYNIPQIFLMHAKCDQRRLYRSTGCYDKHDTTINSSVSTGAGKTKPIFRRILFTKPAGFPGLFAGHSRPPGAAII
jgi:hypothetical protein